MKPLEWFKSQGHGSRKKAVMAMGWHYVWLSKVIHEKDCCSEHFARCLEQYTGGSVRWFECNLREKNTGESND